MGIEARAEFCDQGWQRVREVLVLPSTKAVSRHHDPASEEMLIRIHVRNRLCLAGRDQVWHKCPPLGVHGSLNFLPVALIDAASDRTRHLVGWRFFDLGRFRDSHWLHLAPLSNVAAVRGQTAVPSIL